MSRKVIFIVLAVLISTGVVLALTLSRGERPIPIADPEEPEPPPPDSAQTMTVGDFISFLVTEEYRKAIKGEVPTITEGTIVRVLARVVDFKVVGQHPRFRGEVDLEPYYCSRSVQCIFEGEAVADLENLQREMDVIIEGRYGGITSFLYSHDVYRLEGCSLLSIEAPQTWTTPLHEETIGDALRAEYVVNVQSGLRRGDIVRVYGPVCSVSIDWSYLDGMWGNVLVTRRVAFGVECRFEGEELHKMMNLPEGQEVIIAGAYSHGSVSRAFLTDCMLIYP